MGTEDSENDKKRIFTVIDISGIIECDIECRTPWDTLRHTGLSNCRCEAPGVPKNEFGKSYLCWVARQELLGLSNKIVL